MAAGENAFTILLPSGGTSSVLCGVGPVHFAPIRIEMRATGWNPRLSSHLEFYGGIDFALGMTIEALILLAAIFQIAL